jgi:hypothetical protein
MKVLTGFIASLLSVSSSAQVMHTIDHQRDPRTLVGSGVVSGVVMTDDATRSRSAGRR